MANLSGKTAAVVGTGSLLHRAVAMALAEAGADVAVATRAPTREQEFAVASIANEIWAIGREQLSYVMDERAVGAVVGLIAVTRGKLGRCDALVVIEATVASAEITGVPTMLVGGTGGGAVELATSDGETAERVVARTLALLG